MRGSIIYSLLAMSFLLFMGACGKLQKTTYTYPLETFVFSIPLKLTEEASSANVIYPLKEYQIISYNLSIRSILINHNSLLPYQIDSIKIDSAYLQLDETSQINIGYIDSIKICFTNLELTNNIKTVAYKGSIGQNNTKTLNLDIAPLEDKKFLFSDVYNISITGFASKFFFKPEQAKLYLHITAYARPFKQE